METAARAAAPKRQATPPRAHMSGAAGAATPRSATPTRGSGASGAAGKGSFQRKKVVNPPKEVWEKAAGIAPGATDELVEGLRKELDELNLDLHENKVRRARENLQRARLRAGCIARARDPGTGRLHLNPGIDRPTTEQQAFCTHEDLDWFGNRSCRYANCKSCGLRRVIYVTVTPVGPVQLFGPPAWSRDLRPGAGPHRRPPGGVNCVDVVDPPLVCGTEINNDQNVDKPEQTAGDTPVMCNQLKHARDNAWLMLDTGATDNVGGSSWHNRGLKILGEMEMVPIYLPSDRSFSFGGNPCVQAKGRYIYPIAIGESSRGEIAVHIVPDGKQVCPGLMSLVSMADMGLQLDVMARTVSAPEKDRNGQLTGEMEELEVLGVPKDHMFLDLFSGLEGEPVYPWNIKNLELWERKTGIKKLSLIHI